MSMKRPLQDQVEAVICFAGDWAVRRASFVDLSQNMTDPNVGLYVIGEADERSSPFGR
jgi:hypothetical protein